MKTSSGSLERVKFSFVRLKGTTLYNLLLMAYIVNSLELHALKRAVLRLDVIIAARIVRHSFSGKA
jgi:hypothetical protein